MVIGTDSGKQNKYIRISLAIDYRTAQGTSKNIIIMMEFVNTSLVIPIIITTKQIFKHNDKY
ncbi:MAG: hypothetical protein WBL88_03665 [Nitrososphaeraceae archaeon]